MKKNIGAITAILFFTPLFIIALQTGVSLTNDSCTYLASAISWESKGVFLDVFGNENTIWPPLYSVILSWVGLNELNIILLHYFSILGSIILWIRIFRSTYSEIKFTIVLSILLSTSTGFLLCEKFVWSECVFVFLTSLLLINYLKFLSTSKNNYLIIATISAALLPLQRIAGLYIIILILSGSVLFYTDVVIKNYKKLLVHYLIGLLPFVLWFSQSLGGMSEREEATFDISFLGTVLYDYFLVTSRYLLPVFHDSFLLAGVILLFVIFYFGLIKGEQKIKLFSFVFIGYVILYIVTIFLKKAGDGHQEMERFLTPLYPVFCFIMCYLFRRIDLQIKNKRKIFFISILSLWMLYPCSRAIKNSKLYHQLPQKTGVNIPCDFLLQ